MIIKLGEKAKTSGTLALQLGFDYGNRNKKGAKLDHGFLNVPRTHVQSKFVTEILENEIRANMLIREEKRLKSSDKYKQLQRVSSLYNINPAHQEKLRQIRGRQSTRRKIFYEDDDEDDLEEIHIGNDSKKPQQQQRSKSKMNKRRPKTAAPTRCKKKAQQEERKPGWRTCPYAKPRLFDEYEKCKCKKTTSTKARQQQQNRRPQSAHASYLRPKMIDEKTGICKYCQERKRYGGRPEQTFNGKVAGEVIEPSSEEYRHLSTGIVMVQKELHKTEIIKKLEAPLAEKKKRREMRNEVAKLLLEMPRLRQVNIKRIQEQLEAAGNEHGFIDRTSFVNSMGTSGLTDNNKLYSRLFTSFDIDSDHEIFIKDISTFLQKLQIKSFQMHGGIVRHHTVQIF